MRGDGLRRVAGRVRRGHARRQALDHRIVVALVEERDRAAQRQAAPRGRRWDDPVQRGAPAIYPIIHNVRGVSRCAVTQAICLFMPPVGGCYGWVMAPPRKLPPTPVILKMIAKGATITEVARQSGTSVAAVRHHLKGAGVPSRIGRHDGLIPWRVAKSHTQAHPATMLRVLSRLRAGETVPDVKARTARAWERKVQDAGLVVYYHPRIGPTPASPVSGGFAYVPRRPGEDLIREPPDKLRR